MTKLEKVLKDLDTLIDYWDDVDRFEEHVYGANILNTLTDARTWIEDTLKAQQPRVLTLEEVKDALDTVVWVDRPKFHNLSSEYALITAYSREFEYIELQYPFNAKDYRERSDYKTYNKAWRCWSARPTDEQRKAVKWDEPPKEGDEE